MFLKELQDFIDKRHEEMPAGSYTTSPVSYTHLYQQILKEFPNMHLIASGGVSCIQDIIDLEIAKVPAVVFGKMCIRDRHTPLFPPCVRWCKTLSCSV